MTMEENVARGVALLDEKVPNWRERISAEDLEMSSTRSCILGQLFDHYFYGLEWMFPATNDNGQFESSILHGFTTDTGSFYKLTALWKDELSKR